MRQDFYFFVLFVFAWTRHAVAAIVESDFVCDAPNSYSDVELLSLLVQNCNRVNSAVKDIQNAAAGKWKDLEAEQTQNWQTRTDQAEILCKDALQIVVQIGPATSKEIRSAAKNAVNAWGTVMMQGRECCTILEAPYCIDRQMSFAFLAGLIPFILLVLLFVGSLLVTVFQPKVDKRSKAVLKALRRIQTRPAGPSRPHTLISATANAVVSRIRGGLEDMWMRRNLYERWMHGSCLRVLPNSEPTAKASANLFSALRDTFDFQPDNVRNQFEHLISLWRSQVAMVADRQVEKREPVDESILLGTSLGDLHAELMDGFLKWRSKLCEHERSFIPQRLASQPSSLGGLQWGSLSGMIDATPIGEHSNAQLSKCLEEVSTFLLVWGEAGNLRFMPEVIYFITELALAAKDPSTSRSDVAEDRSNNFLAKIIRPIYNTVFDEIYDEVSINEANQRDVKKLHHGYDDFLPQRAANYDDWNELFCQPEKLVMGIILQDGTSLFDLPHESRYAALPLVDWPVSLLSAATKTHREVHSLWGVFASTHRVWLTHSLMFFTLMVIVCGTPPATAGQGTPISGRAAAVRAAAVVLVIPIHAILWWCARWKVTGPSLRKPWLERLRGCVGGGVFQWWRKLMAQPSWGARVCTVMRSPPDVVALLPIVSYVLVRLVDDGSDNVNVGETAALTFHYLFGVFALFHLLFVPTDVYNLWELTPVPLHKRMIRYFFWIAILALKFGVGIMIMRVVDDTIADLNIARLGEHKPGRIFELLITTSWWANVLVWLVIWTATYILFNADTQLWFTLCCTFLGVATVFHQRKWQIHSVAFEHALSKIPERFSKKVFAYSKRCRNSNDDSGQFSASFPYVWDRIVAYMRYEDEITGHTMADLCFDSRAGRDKVLWEDLRMPLKVTAGRTRLARQKSAVTGLASVLRLKFPGVFNRKHHSETCFKTYCCISDSHEPESAGVRWRISALGRGLALPMPRPFRAPFFPGITVMIPHYGEQILIQKKDLFKEDDRSVVPLMHWLKQKYSDEFLSFSNRMKSRSIDWPVAGDQWDEYTDEQWEKITSWAAMRLQTLWRTVAGICYAHPALQCHFEAQADTASSLSQDGVWDPSECFTCLVSMQMYKFFDKTQLEHTDRMLKKFPDCFKIAFIDYKKAGPNAKADNVHSSQERRYYSCLIDRNCQDDPGGRKIPVFRVELPGYPILGDGKGDNQNHAIPFMRGHFSQCIDANQGAYFEQMLLLPCALGEFRTRARGDGLGKRIVGFPEHITSDIGSIGDFAASAEIAFGTILQRTYAVLGARMHYGHPDIMNKVYMMQQGGVSKATKTLNLSEDIFAGMDFTLRGDGRQIKHCEYFHLAKGRDMGFNAVLGFFSKLSSGTGEQLLSRQTFRLGQVLHLPEALSFYYAHAGYYLNQFLVSVSMPLLVFTWLLVLLSDCEEGFSAFQHCRPGQRSSADVMAKFLAACFSWLVPLFLVANTMPLICELWLQVNLYGALSKFFTSVFTLSPLMFIFQAKTIGHYITNEVRFGGATYVATGRGLPTERRPIIGKTAKGQYEGLYLDYANIAFYDGATLLAAAIAIRMAGGTGLDENEQVVLSWTWVSAALTITSWLYAPFIFNPYNFSARLFFGDMKSLYCFFLKRSGKNWNAWYERTLIKPRKGIRASMNDVGFYARLLLLTSWYAILNLKAEVLTTIYSEVGFRNFLYVAILLPPLVFSLVYCCFVVFFENLAGCRTVARKGLSSAQGWAMESAARAAITAARKIQGDGAVAARAKVRKDLQRDVLEGENEDEQNRSVDRSVDPPDSTPLHTRGFSIRRQRTRVWEDGLPLAISAIIVVALDIGEAVAACFFFRWHGWGDAFLAGLILKWGLLSMCLWLAESMLRKSNCFTIISLPLHHWIRAHRMARDIMVSLVITLPQLPIVFLNWLNDYVCPGCSAHQLLLYRDPGTIERKEIVFDLENYDENVNITVSSDDAPVMVSMETTEKSTTKTNGLSEVNSSATVKTAPHPFWSDNKASKPTDLVQKSDGEKMKCQTSTKTTATIESVRTFWSGGVKSKPNDLEKGTDDGKGIGVGNKTKSAKSLWSLPDEDESLKEEVRVRKVTKKTRPREKASNVDQSTETCPAVGGILSWLTGDENKERTER